MADKLLSQSDIDDMVESLARNKPEAQITVKPTPEANSRTIPTVNSVTMADAVHGAAAKTAPKTPAMPQRPTSSVPPVLQEQKVDTSANFLSGKVAELSNQMAQMAAGLQRLAALEARMSQLETQVMRNRESLETAKQVQLLGAELKKISVNLLGTPRYGIRHTFHCDKC